MKNRLPLPTVKRLSLYLRAFEELDHRGITHISSKGLSEILEIPDTQIRKDLSFIGKTGRRGKGYPVRDLIQRIREILGLKSYIPIILVGVGNLGSALLASNLLKHRGFRIVGAFDVDVSKIGKKFCDVRIQDDSKIPEFVKEYGIKLAILTTPGEAAQHTAEILVSAGISGILNFTPENLSVPPYVKVHNVDFTIEMEFLNYLVNAEVLE